jgi:hypothetical protein
VLGGGGGAPWRQVAARRGRRAGQTVTAAVGHVAPPLRGHVLGRPIYNRHLSELWLGTVAEDHRLISEVVITPTKDTIAIMGSTIVMDIL